MFDFRRGVQRCLAVLALFTLYGCTGSIVDVMGDDGEGDTSSGEASLCAGEALPVQPLRRLSSVQYENTLRELFGPALAEPFISGSLFPKTQISAGFVNDAESNLVNTAESNAIEDNAARIAKLLLEQPQPYLEQLLPCPVSNPASDAEIDACIGQFITQFGARAYRRPLTEAESSIVQRLYDGLRAEDDARAAWTATVQFFVQSPALLYRTERGGERLRAGMVRLTDHEIATRLSYLFTNAPPDAELRKLADAGELHTRRAVREQAERLLGTPAFAEAFARFHRDWLRSYELEHSSKDTAAFPDFTPEVLESLLEEPGQLARFVVEQGDGRIQTLFDTSVWPLNATLAKWYGVSEAAPAPGVWQPYEVPNRRGILTSAGVMATLANTNRTNPIHRGAFVQREILCRSLPTLPGNIDTQTALKDTSTRPTARERLQPLLEVKQCSGCHSQFNPIGLAFESYDAVGRFRDQENGAAIDTSGSADFGAGQTHYTSPVELSGGLAESELVRDCYSLQWYRAAMGRKEFAEDNCSIRRVQEVAAETGGDIREVLLAITQTDAFMFRTEAVE